MPRPLLLMRYVFGFMSRENIECGFGVVNKKLGTGQIFSTPPPFPLPTQKFHSDLGDLTSPLDLDRTLAEKIQLRIALDSSS